MVAEKYKGSDTREVAFRLGSTSRKALAMGWQNLDDDLSCN